MTGAEVGGATLLKVGLAVVQRTAPTGISLVRSWLKGKDVIVVGQARAGKTTFLDYFQYGLFEDEKETSKTVDVTHTARFNIKMGRDSALELIVKTAIDVPGQNGPIALADLVYKQSPRAIVIMTDLTSPLRGERSSREWLFEFCKRLESKWRVERGRKTNRIRSMILVMNKRDKVDERREQAIRTAFRKILDVELKEARGEMLDEIAIMPCTLVTNPKGTKMADSVIAHMAKSLAR
jgi:GTPase SAR1 family protein